MSSPVNAFLTGSRAYGTPREDSDIDLAVLLPPEICTKLWSLREGTEGSLRFGNLNLLTFTTQSAFDQWKKVTTFLESIGPVTRDQAVAAFTLFGCNSYGQNVHALENPNE